MVFNRLAISFLILQVVNGAISDLSLQNIEENPQFRFPVYKSDGSIEWFPRIIGGEYAQLGDFRGKLSLQYRQTGSHFCGATLINETVAVTAAHCVVQGQQLKENTIQLMGDDLSIRPPASPSRQIVYVKKIVAHPKYNANTLINDVAVLILEKPMRQTATFHPISSSMITPAYNKICQVAGWGVTVDSTGAPVSPYLMKVDVAIMDLRICNISYEGGLTTNMICAGYAQGGRDSCQGDSGGGLICDNILAGIVSFGYGCAQPNYPGIYTDVSKYNDWITKASGDKPYISITVISFSILSILLMNS